MKIFLAGPHMLTRLKNGYQFAQQVFNHEDIFSREQWKEKNNNCIMGGENCIKRYLNENISGDSWGGTGMPEPFRRLLENNADIFSGGGVSALGL